MSVLLALAMSATACGMPVTSAAGRRVYLPIAVGRQTPAPTVPAPQVAGCAVFPRDNVWNTRVDLLPTHPNSDAYVAAIGANAHLHPDFGTWWEGQPIGIPFATVPGDQPSVPVTVLYADESDPGPYPIPPGAPIEGGPGSQGDRHVLIVDSGHCMLYELFDAWPQADGGWHAAAAAAFDLSSNSLRPQGWTSADAAGLPILPGLVRYEEVTGGRIEHALRFTAPQTRAAYVWPARHQASPLTGEQYPPMGQRFRLRKEVDISEFSPAVRPILVALKEYGMFLADNGAPWFLTGTHDPRWDDELLDQIKQLRGSDFEAVDGEVLMVHADSVMARVP
jgi:hypothetical protein